MTADLTKAITEALDQAEPRKYRPSPGRARCPRCGGNYALTVGGNFPLHNRAFNRCPGSRTPAEGSDKT
jgi:hypothetical protein